MKVVFISNFMNHHQLPFSLEMVNLTNNQYTFVATQAIPDSRLKLGYEDMNHRYAFVCNAYETKEKEKEAMKLSYEADVVILGSGSEKYIEKRLKDHKLTFCYHERIYKAGIKKRKLFHDILSSWIHFGRFGKFPYYMLCASAYTAQDCFRFHNFVNKTYKWGYFPEVKHEEIEDLLTMKKNNTVPNILWCGRLIEWKHPEMAIYLAEKLKSSNYRFKLNIIGIGDLKEKLEELIKEKNLENYVKMLGSMSPEKVRNYMEKSNIFLFTSDFNEGWGAVLNESMNSCCAVVASHAIGSVPFLLKDGVNGLIFKSENQEDLNNKVIKLFNDSELQIKLGEEAYKTIIDEWNAAEAAKRLLNISESLIRKNPKQYSSGPCSIAERLENEWYEDE